MGNLIYILEGYANKELALIVSIVSVTALIIFLCVKSFTRYNSEALENNSDWPNIIGISKFRDFHDRKFALFTGSSSQHYQKRAKKPAAGDFAWGAPQRSELE